MLSRLAPTHLSIDGIISDAGIFLPTDNVRRYLAELILLLDMTAIAEPLVLYCELTLIGIQAIAESHISVHINIETGMFHGDVFSCTEFDVLLAVKYIKNFWALSPMKYRLHHRTVPLTGG